MRTERTKALLFVSPSNPTGAVYSREEMEAIGRWCLENGIWVIAYEIYEHLTFDGLQSHSMPVVVPEIADQTVIINGVAKTYAMTGMARRLVDWSRGCDQSSGKSPFTQRVECERHRGTGGACCGSR